MPIPPTIICTTPVRNEAWIIERFLAAASVWADVIILIDQHSTDGTREIARCFPKVRLSNNPLEEYNEGHYRRLMFAETRKIPGPRLIFALDADEFLNADLLDTPDWQTLLTLPAGTVAFVRWVNLRDNFRSCHVVDDPVQLCYMDDGLLPEDTFIHCKRLPVHPTVPPLILSDARLLHYQYIHWERMKAKQRWYQALELMRHPEINTLHLYRAYHHMDISWARQDPVLETWFTGYEARGIAVRDISLEPHSWFEIELLKLFELYGTTRFRKLSLWESDWPALATYHGFANPDRFRDPRNGFERLVHRWLRATQDHYRTLPVRLIGKVLSMLGW